MKARICTTYGEIEAVEGSSLAECLRHLADSADRRGLDDPLISVTAEFGPDRTWHVIAVWEVDA